MKCAKAIPVFMYHHVSPVPGLVTISPAAFLSQMAAIAHAGWRTAGLADLANFKAGGELPERTCILSFDDGYLDNFVYAHPVLAEFGLHAVLFLVSGWLGDGPSRQGMNVMASHGQCKNAISEGRADEVMLRWSEVDEMAVAGTFEFHSHTHSHRRWDKEIADNDQRYEALLADLAASRSCLTERLGNVSAHLCWPQGYYDDLYKQCAVESGFDYLYSTEKKVVTATTDPLAIGRIVTKEKTGEWLLNRAQWFSHPWLGNAYSWLQRH